MREKLSRDRVLRAAVAFADEHGLDALSMRKLAAELGVEAMSLYHHVANKDALLDGMVDAVVAEFEVPDADDWQEAMRHRADSVRTALARHPWAVGLLDSRAAAGPATLAHHDAVLGCLRRAGFSIVLAGHAFALLDSFLYGFALQERNLPFGSPEELRDLADAVLADAPAEEFPHLVEFARERVLAPGYDFGDEFAYSLELILHGLARALAGR